MRKQALVIGLGQFGSAVARALVVRDVEVLAVDENEDRVRAIAPYVTEAACFDATDEAALARTSPERRDVCVCAIGDESKEASIICTALLKQMGAKRVIARSDDEIHGRILRLVGANQVVNPEREYGDRFANQIVHEGIRGEMLLGEGILITEVTVPDAVAGVPLVDLKLRKRFEVTVVAIRRNNTGEVIVPGPDSQFEAGDMAVLVGKDKDVVKFLEQR